jgi:hypothetical protein
MAWAMIRHGYKPQSMQSSRKQRVEPEEHSVVNFHCSPHRTDVEHLTALSVTGHGS